jgi:hypothetical protein
MARVAVARTCARLYGLGLVLAALAKSHGPHAAAAGLLWTHFGLNARLALILVGSFVELLVGLSVLVGVRCRPVVLAGLATAATLLILHLIGMASSSSSCGCFGDLPVPDGVTLGILGMGMVGCATAMRSAQARPNWRRLGLLLLPAVAAPALALLSLAQQPKSPAETLRRLLGVGQEGNAIALVGTWSCADCRHELERIVAQRRSTERIFFVTRESERQRAPVSVESVERAQVPDLLWWQLVPSKPPVVLRFGPEVAGVVTMQK